MTVLLIDPFSSGASYPPLLQDADVAYCVVRTQRALDSGLSAGEPVPSLVFDHASEGQLGDLFGFCRDHGLSSVITGAESGVPLAEALKVKLGLASTDFADQGRRFWDKSLLYSTVAHRGVRVPERIGEFAPAAVTTGCHRRQMEAATFPAVVKPDVGAGSVGVRIVHTPEQGIDAIESITGAPGFFGGGPPTAVVQECVTGREYVVDTVSHTGRHRIVSVCTYDKHPSSRGTMVYDRLRWLDWKSWESACLAEYAAGVLNALDHREGSVHMEVIIDDHGPCLIDLGARPHGAGHPLKTHALTGSSQLHAEVALAAGCAVPSTEGYHLRARASIEFLSLDRSASIRSDVDPTELLRCDFVLSGEVLARPGAAYPETLSLLDSEALGLLFVSGRDDEEVADNAAALREAFDNMVDKAGYAR